MAKKSGIIMLFALIVISYNLNAQEISEKQDITIFKLGAYEWNIPRGALGGIDEEIKGKFISLGRFNVFGLNQRLGQDDVNAFIEELKLIKAQEVDIPEEYKTGDAILTENDFNQLVGSFYVVVPVVSQFNVAYDEDNKVYDAEIKTSFTILNVEDGSMQHFFVETTGEDKNKDFAINTAIDKIPINLEFELQKIFTIKTAILDVQRNEIYMALGQNMGIKPGYEYSITETEITPGGLPFERKTGLVVVKDVGTESSLGTLIYGNPQAGDQLQEIPRVGFELVPYMDILLDPMFKRWDVSLVLGVRASWTKGLYFVRPFFGFEIPIPLPKKNVNSRDIFLSWLYLFGLPINVYGGVEFNFYIRRLQFTPQLGLGAGFFVPYKADEEGEDKQVFTHIGFIANLNLNYLITDRLKITIDARYKFWFCPFDTLFDAAGTRLRLSYGGIMLGFGLTIKI